MANLKHKFKVRLGNQDITKESKIIVDFVALEVKNRTAELEKENKNLREQMDALNKDYQKLKKERKRIKSELGLRMKKDIINNRLYWMITKKDWDKFWGDKDAVQKRT